MIQTARTVTDFDRCKFWQMLFVFRWHHDAQGFSVRRLIMFSDVDSEDKSSLAHTSKKICFHEASNMSLIEYLSVAGKQINKYETINKAVRLQETLGSVAVMTAIFWLTEVTAAPYLVIYLFKMAI